MSRTPLFKFLQIGVVALLALAFTLGTASTQPAQAATATQISAGWMPFAASFPNSNINLNGLVRILTHWQSVSDSET